MSPAQPKLNLTFWVWFLSGVAALWVGWAGTWRGHAVAWDDRLYLALSGLGALLAAVFVNSAQMLREDGIRRPWATLAVVTVVVLALKWSARGLVLAVIGVFAITYNYVELATRPCVNAEGTVQDSDPSCGTGRDYLKNPDGSYYRQGSLNQLVETAATATYWRRADRSWLRVDRGQPVPREAVEQIPRKHPTMGLIYDPAILPDGTRLLVDGLGRPMR